MGMPVANYSVGGFGAANGSAEIAAAGAYTGKISLMSNSQPFPRPSMNWNGTYCPVRSDAIVELTCGKKCSFSVSLQPAVVTLCVNVLW